MRASEPGVKGVSIAAESAAAKLLSGALQRARNDIDRCAIVEAVRAAVAVRLLRDIAAARGLDPEIPSGLFNYDLELWLTSSAVEYTLCHLDSVINTVAARDSDPIVQVAHAVERLYAWSGNGELGLDAPARRDEGAYYTSPELAALLTSLTLAGRQWAAAPRIVDPALGTGIFLIYALRELAKDNRFGSRRSIAERCLFGVDRDPFAVSVARALVWLEVGDDQLSISALEPNLRVGDSLLATPADWRKWFPGASNGFDIVLSNPPWGAVKPQRREFFAYFDQKARDYQGDSLRRYLEDLSRDGAQEFTRTWTEYVASTREYAAALRTHPRFTHQGPRPGASSRGDLDLYKFFTELAFDLCSDDGRVGLVLPAAFQRAEGAGALRHLYLNSGNFEHLLEFHNRKRLFPIHGMFRFLLTVFERGNARGVRNAAFGLLQASDARPTDPTRRVELTSDFIYRVGGRSAAVPEVRSTSERDLLTKLYQCYPTLGQPSDDWNVRFCRELDMTNDSAIFVDVAATNAWRVGPSGVRFDDDGRRYLPIYEGRMVHQFDAAAKGYRGGQGRRAHWEPLPFGNKRTEPHFLIEESLARAHGVPEHARAGFCDITGHANERTVLAAVIPTHAACGNKVPTCRFDRDDERLDYLWVALANSFVIDWVLRRWISTTLNFFYWWNVPFPRLDPARGVGRDLALASECLADPDLDLWERAWIRAGIDAAVAELFGLSLDEFEFILSDFGLLDRPSRSVVVAQGASVTMNTALLAYAKRLGMPSPELTRLEDSVSRAREAGAVAYLPSGGAAEMKTTTRLAV